MLTVVASLKGGTGKSTLAFNLGVWLQKNHPPVQLLDLDPQGTLTDVIAVREEEGFEPALTVSSPPLQKLRKMDFSDNHWLADVSVGDHKRMGADTAKSGPDRGTGTTQPGRCLVAAALSGAAGSSA